MAGIEAYSIGFYNRLCEPSQVVDEASVMAATLASGPSQAHAITKRMLREEWDMGVVAAINAEAAAQAVCMETNDFRRAYEAFIRREKPRFEGD
jgi:enoyl-CoA hydratase/carnithine racemase